MHFLNPAWFFAIAAIALPIAIHLWNVKPGKVLKVGSISLIQENSRKSSRSFKLTDLLLLAVRCLLLVLIACLLVAPFTKRQIKAGKQKGWVLLPKETLLQGYRSHRKLIDSLLTQGYEFHFFTDGFPKLDTASLYAGLKIAKDSADLSSSDYWGSLRQLDSRLGRDVPVYLFTSNSIDNFKGSRPQVALNLKWQTFTTSDSTGSWLQDAWFTKSHDIRVISGTTNSNEVNFDYTTFRPGERNSRFKTGIRNGRPVIGLADKPGMIAIDTTRVTIAIYAEHNIADAQYLNAALQAVVQYTDRPVTIHQYSSPQLIPASAKWLFWLSADPVPARFVNNTSNLVVYQYGKRQHLATVVKTNGQYALPSGEEQAAVFNVPNIANSYDNLIWSDGFGRPVLAAHQTRKGKMYSLFTHLSPAWGDVVWGSTFPQLILQLVFDTKTQNLVQYDKRHLATTAFLPLQENKKEMIASKLLIVKRLDSYFWLAVVILFFVERLLATANQRQANG